MQIIHQREQAIKTALQSAVENDVVLIAGKGREIIKLLEQLNTIFGSGNCKSITGLVNLVIDE